MHLVVPVRAIGRAQSPDWARIETSFPSPASPLQQRRAQSPDWARIETDETAYVSLFSGGSRPVSGLGED